MKSDTCSFNYKKTYSKDKRKDINFLYKTFLSLPETHWITETVDNHVLKSGKKKIFFPVLSMKTKKKGKAVWILSGTHGEEPAGPVAIAENIKLLENIGKKVPMVIFPLLNPTGYYRNWRYLFHWKDWKKGRSMGDCEPFLLGKNNKPIAKKTNIFADRLTKYVFALSKQYPPWIVLDLHEDENSTAGGDPLYNEDKFHENETYIYSQGKFGYKDLIAKKIVEIMEKFEHPLVKNGVVETGDEVINGIVSNIKDNSIDEFLSSNKVFFNGKITKGPSARTLVVVETLTKDLSLSKRVKIHSEILQNIRKFLELSRKQRAN